MQRSKAECYVHFVWATHDRHPFLTPEIEHAVFRCVGEEIQRLHCELLAIGGIPDHIHCVVRLHSTVAIARLAQAMKGVSSRLVNYEMGLEGAFDWQDHYGAFSVSRSHLTRVVRYVKNQKERHSSGKIWAEWEETEIDHDCDVSVP